VDSQSEWRTLSEFEEDGVGLQTWPSALSKNKRVPKWDRTIGETLEICLPAQLKRHLCATEAFVRSQSTWRDSHGQVPDGWAEICELRMSGHYLYAPRWTFPIFYFRGRYASFFDRLLGLDIGARVSRSDDPVKAGPLKFADDNPMLRESFRPHWKHYEELGATMRAIDTLADPAEPRIEAGDVRLLPFQTSSFDFITLPMLFGPGNPCSTSLEIVTGISEVHRVLRPNGFAYLADGILHPGVCFAAQLVGFTVLISKGTENGMPVGTILTKGKDSEQTSGRFLDRATLSTFTFSSKGHEIVSHCNLIDDSEPPRVYAGYFDPSSEDVKR
jgi:hypothetical protein